MLMGYTVIGYKDNQFQKNVCLHVNMQYITCTYIFIRGVHVLVHVGIYRVNNTVIEHNHKATAYTVMDQQCRRSNQTFGA